ncbi:ChaN family lipoprotein [Pseudacidovorax intermedius]|uniref:ChaN family lipoprotein n=1 Tax=Pseudacidovorax intermedius TaxID=433924 RepID=UPI0026F237B5|nr:ChaN family lipoprotein [Pseudacidovorax intermedius]
MLSHLPLLCRRAALSMAAMLATGCAGLAGPAADAPDTPLSRRLDALLPAQVLILGEQHDADAHHALERETVQQLAARQRLAAVALEMADSGRSTAALPPTATEAQARAALAWNERAWPWAAYGPVVMAAVGAGVPVLGANLPRARMKDAMADVSLDAQLPPPAWQAQVAAVRDGHCGLLPESQMQPMTRIQVARDREMARTVAQAAQAAAPSRVVLLVTGAGHADPALGVPQHLPTDMTVRSVRMAAGGAGADRQRFDALWATPAVPPKDYCAELRKPAAPARP